jgi:hypothetical protein
VGSRAETADLVRLAGGGPLATGKLRLMRAVLEDALRIVLDATPIGRSARRAREEAARWIFEDDFAWPYSFRNVCRALLVDPAELRRRVRAHRTEAGIVRPAA